MKLRKFMSTTAVAFALVLGGACSSDDNAPATPDNPTTTPDPTTNPDPEPEPEDQSSFIIGAGIQAGDVFTQFVLPVEDLMTGTISFQNAGTMQEGFRTYHSFNGKFYSIGGDISNDVNVFSLNDDGELQTIEGPVFDLINEGLIDTDGTATTLLGISSPENAEIGTDVQLYTYDTATDAINNVTSTPIPDVNPIDEEGIWMRHTGVTISNDKVYQSILPYDPVTFDTPYTDTLYIAVYSYPEFEFQEVIKDTRTGPAGGYGKSGVFTAENGDVYAISHTSFSIGYSQTTKAPAILKIPAGTNEFDEDYFFNTLDAANGGRITHADYIGDNKLFAYITTEEPSIDTRWTGGCRMAIIDLVGETITLVEGGPQFVGPRAASYDGFYDASDGKVYTINEAEAGVLDFYQTDVATATATKGARLEANFLSGIGKVTN